MKSVAEKRIFITGGTGFLGRHLIAELKKNGHRLLVLSRKPRNERGLEFLKGNILNAKAWTKKLKTWKPDIAIHLAWEGIPSFDIDTCTKNLVGGINCLHAFGEAGVKTVLVAGSDQEYGHGGDKMSETSQPKPYNMLYATKVALYVMASKIAENYKMNLIWTRIFFVYGAGQRSKALIPYLVRSIRANAVPEIRNPYGANDFIYINDVTRAIRMLIEKKPKSTNEIYNVGSGKLEPTIDVIESVYAFFALPMPPISRTAKRPATWKGAYADIRKIKKDIGWKPKIGLETGVATMLRETLDT